jgi:hypothetical protein
MSESPRQIPLPGFEPRTVPAEDPGLVSEAMEVHGAPPDERQLDLFAERTGLEREIDLAMASGQFEEAQRLRDLHRGTYGAVPATTRLAFLDALANGCAQSLADALAVWETIDRQLPEQPALRARARDGLFRRLLSSHAPAELAAAWPSCLASLVNFLTKEARAAGEEISLEARRLARDALLAGQALHAGDIEDDSRLADLLGENLEPPWLGCLGVIRRLWPVPRATAAELRDFEGVGCLVGVERDALCFWECLRVAETPECPEELLHEARRRMKKLHGDFHALYIRRVRLVAEP